MLRIHDTMLEALVTMRPIASAIDRWDRDLARQLRRAASSVAPRHRRGKGLVWRRAQQRYRTALGSARETLSCLRVAVACGYVEELPPKLIAEMNHVIGTLVRVGI